MADKKIKITVKNRKATLVGTPVIVCGNSDYTVTFTFDDEWSLTGLKTARFVYIRDGVQKYEDVVFSGNTVSVPVLSDVAFVSVGVFEGNLSTTTPARILCTRSILCGTGAAQGLTEDVYNQLLAEINELAAKGAFGATEEQLNRLKALEVRVDALVALDEIVDGDAVGVEVVDARTDYTGHTWGSLGGHIRGVASALDEKINEGADQLSGEIVGNLNPLLSEYNRFMKKIYVNDAFIDASNKLSMVTPIIFDSDVVVRVKEGYKYKICTWKNADTTSGLKTSTDYLVIDSEVPANTYFTIILSRIDNLDMNYKEANNIYISFIEDVNDNIDMMIKTLSVNEFLLPYYSAFKRMSYDSTANSYTQSVNRLSLVKPIYLERSIILKAQEGYVFRVYFWQSEDMSAGFISSVEYTSETVVSKGSYITVVLKRDDDGEIYRENIVNLYSENVSNNLLNANLASVYMSGGFETLTSKEDKIDVSIIIETANGTKIECTGKCKWQGSGSIKYPKKNYTISNLSESFNFVTYDGNFSEDVDTSTLGPLYKTREWGVRDKFVLKADYIDHSHARNVVSARLWGDVVSTRNNADETLLSLSNYGAIDGFPIKVYINDVYQGLYNLTIPKDKKLLGMSDNTKHAFVCGEAWGNGVYFYRQFHPTPFIFDDGDVCVITQEDYENYIKDGITPAKAWVIEWDDESSDWVPNSLNNISNIVIDDTAYADGEMFRKAIEKYVDVDSLIDYIIFIHVFHLKDNWGRNMILGTYDGVKWFASAYDLDTAFGIHYSGEAFFPLDSWLLTKSLYRYSNKLFYRIITNYSDKFKERYAQLRAIGGALSNSNIFDKIYGYCKEVPDTLLNIENDVYSKVQATSKYPTLPSNGISNSHQMLTWVAERLKLMDNAIIEL